MKDKKVILITGASSGMGKVTAKDLIEQGHIVYTAARSIEKMKDLEKLGGHIIEMDMSKKETVKLGVQKIIEESGRIDVLWNNAGYGLYGTVEEIDMSDARYQFEVNVFGLAELTQEVLPYMRKQESGLIINTSSMGGKIYTPLGAWYHATKHAIEGFSDCLRLEVKDFGINVVVLEPGLIDTGFINILEKNFVDKGSESPYQKIISNFKKASLSGNIKGSSPQVISNTIQKIISSKNPKTRYLVGKMACSSVVMRRILGDKIFDKLIMSQFK